MGAKAPLDIIMENIEKDDEWKTRLSKQIIARMKELNIKTRIKTTRVIGKHGKPVTQVEIPESLPGLHGDDRITKKEILLRASAKKPVELWYCRAVATRHKLDVRFFDWFFYHGEADFSSQEK